MFFRGLMRDGRKGVDIQNQVWLSMDYFFLYIRSVFVPDS